MMCEALIWAPSQVRIIKLEYFNILCAFCPWRYGQTFSSGCELKFPGSQDGDLLGLSLQIPITSFLTFTENPFCKSLVDDEHSLKAHSWDQDHKIPSPSDFSLLHFMSACGVPGWDCSVKFSPVQVSVRKKLEEDRKCIQILPSAPLPALYCFKRCMQPSIVV